MRASALVLALVLTACAPSRSGAPTTGGTASPVPAATSAPLNGCRPAATADPVTLAGRSLVGLHFVDRSVGWVISGIGPDTRVLRTLDGGGTWSSGKPLAMSYAIDLRFADRCAGWVLGVADGGARIILSGTADGGLTWREQLARPNQGRLTGATSGLGPLEVPDGTHGFVVADLEGCSPPCRSELLGTTDGGANWRSLHVFSARVSALRFADANTGWAVVDDPTSGGGPALEATSDGGRTWVRRVLPPFAAQIEVRTALDGWALGRDGAYCTSSSCARWYLYRTRDGGATWSRLHDSDDPTKRAWWLPNPQASSASFLSGPRFVDERHGWIALSIGAGGAGVRVGGVITTADGGDSWQQSGVEPYPKSPNGVWFVDAQNGWATSGSLVKRGADELYRTVDGGSTWQMHP